MEDRDRTIRELHQKLEELFRQQKTFQAQIQKIQNDIFELSARDKKEIKPAIEQREAAKPEAKISPVDAKTQVISPPVSQQTRTQPQPEKEKTPVEEFIGANLLNKIGIAVLVIGIAFGAKYSIDQGLLTPLTRIITGYTAGVALILLALWLKKAHGNFSAVLLSGGVAVLYFLTYAAYDFYSLIPQTIAFALMVLLTASTVFAATHYNKEVIGIIGLVGAYAVPVLLSDGSGRVVILFSYITIINTGILILAFKKTWKRLYYLAFGLTWFTFIAWYSSSFDINKHFAISLIFSTVFFLSFYATFLSYKLVRKEGLSKADLIFMLLNSFFFYGYGYLTIDSSEDGSRYQGLFTLCTALLHLIASLIVYTKQSQRRDTFYFMAGMVLVFITLAVPVQLDGNWVTLLWASEAALLFWIGRSKTFPVYEKLSYPLIILAFLSLLHDWGNTYHEAYFYTRNEAGKIIFLLNIQFLTTVLVTSALSFILWQSRQQRYPSFFVKDSPVSRTFRFGLPLLVLFILYAGIFKEVETFWNQRFADSAISIRSEYGGEVHQQFNQDLLHFKTLWLIFYSAMFALALAVIQIRFVKDRLLMVLSLTVNALVILSFLTSGLIELSELRSRYLHEMNSHYILIRYVGYILIVPLMLINFRYLKKNEFFNTTLRQSEQILFHVAVLILLSSELVHWLDITRIENSFKLALSILWGAYALFLIVLGLWKDLKHIRITAMVLFGITLIKLFLYDMAGMSTIAKTLVMIILGALLLIASFLYNKYKRSAENEIA